MGVNVSVSEDTNTHMPFLVRICFLVFGVLLIVKGASDLALMYIGETTTAAVTKVDTRQEEGEEYKTTVEQRYTYTVDGTEYSGTATFTLKDKDGYTNVGSYSIPFDQKFIEEKEGQKTIQIKYLPIYPKVSDAEENAKLDVTGVLIRIGVFFLALIFLFFAFARNKQQNRVTVQSYQPTVRQVPNPPQVQQQMQAMQQPVRQAMQQPMQQPVQQTMQQTMQQPVQQPMQRSVRPKFCPACGTPTTDGNFCEQCGARLV